MKRWHLQNVVNANFFTSIHTAMGTKNAANKPMTRLDLYRLPGEKDDELFEDASTPEGREKINARIKSIGK